MTLKSCFNIILWYGTDVRSLWANHLVSTLEETNNRCQRSPMTVDSSIERTDRYGSYRLFIDTYVSVCVRTYWLSACTSYRAVIVCGVTVQEILWILLHYEKLFFIENLEESLAVNILYISTDAIVLFRNSRLIGTSNTIFFSLFFPFLHPISTLTQTISFQPFFNMPYYFCSQGVSPIGSGPQNVRVQVQVLGYVIFITYFFCYESMVRC